MSIKKGTRGEVWFAYDENGKKRPFVIVSKESDTIVEIDHNLVRVTSQSPRNKYDIVIEDLKTAGLDRPSIVRCSKITTVHNEVLNFKVGHLAEEDLQKVLKSLQEYFSE